jgi:hypothetical protein
MCKIISYPGKAPTKARFLPERAAQFMPNFPRAAPRDDL